MQHWETLDARTVDGFEIVCSKTWDDTHPRDCFDDSIDDINEICRKIDAGLLDWFVVRVEAYKCGILLGSEYLGGCLYEDAKDFIKEDEDYYKDLIYSAVKQANEAIAELIEAKQGGTK